MKILNMQLPLRHVKWLYLKNKTKKTLRAISQSYIFSLCYDVTLAFLFQNRKGSQISYDPRIQSCFWATVQGWNMEGTTSPME